MNPTRDPVLFVVAVALAAASAALATLIFP